MPLPEFCPDGWISRDEQLARWVAGESVHRGPKSDMWSECCPDFSCCKPALLQPKQTRLTYAASTPAWRSQFESAFLKALIDSVESNIAIAGPSSLAS
jgi:hypothetical protein